MAKMIRSGALLVLCVYATLASAAEIGREIPVTESTATQRDVVISRRSARTLVAFEETAEGQPGRIVLHQYEANLGVPLGRATFTVDASPRPQRRPALGDGMVAWVEEPAGGTEASVWYQAVGGWVVGSNFAPQGKAVRVDAAAPGTRIAIANTHVFHVLVWTGVDGRLKGAFRSLIARIGYDASPFPLTSEPAIHPATGLTWSSHVPLIAYNYPAGGDTPGHGVRATTLWGMSPQPPVDIAPAGASAPRVVFNGTDFVVFCTVDGATYAQRVSTTGGRAVKIGGVEKVHDGLVHDATLSAGGEYHLVLDEGPRFVLLRLDRDLERLDLTPFHARLAAGERISISGDQWLRSMLAYASETRAVVRTVEDHAIPQRRRSVR